MSARSHSPPKGGSLGRPRIVNQQACAPVKISMVQCATDTRTRSVSVEQILQAIRTGGRKLKGQITQIRNRFEAELAITGDRTKAKAAVSGLKKQLAAVTPSGGFNERKADALIEHSGFLHADLDSLGESLPEIRGKLQKSPNVFCCYLSATGDGLKAWFRVPADASKHAGSFRAVEKYVKELTGVRIDQACKDVSRLSFMSFDPEVYVNEGAVEITPEAEPEKQKSRDIAECNSKPDKAQIREMLAVIPKRPHYSDWIKVVSAVGDALPHDEAIDALIEWSAEEQRGEYGDKLRHRLEDVHIGTLVYLAQQHGWTANRHTLQSEGDDTAITRLAALPLLEYERVRKSEAEKLDVRASLLDKLVSAERVRDASGFQGIAVTLPDVEPWPEAVDGAEILATIAGTFDRYVVMSAGVADVSALWCAHTHCFRAFQCSPRMNVTSPEKNCGKTTLRDVVSLFVPRPLLTENFTTAVLFRLVDSQSPVILADEYDSWLSNKEELRGLLNAGHRKGAMVYRCEGDNNEVRGFVAYAPAVLCGIGALPATLHDRSIVIRIERAKRGELKARFDSRKVEAEHELCRKLARWCADNRVRLESCDPQLPEGVFNRLADNWRPLFAIAEIAGGDWPQRCADAFAKLTSTDADADGIRILLLEDIRQVFTAERMFSKDLIEKLAELTERPWPEVCRGKPITERWLANNLRVFGIQSGNIRIDEKQAKGYQRTDFAEAFARYLPDRGILSVPASHTEVKTPNSIRPKDEVGTDEKTGFHEALGRWDGKKEGVSQKGDIVL